MEIGNLGETKVINKVNETNLESITIVGLLGDMISTLNLIDKLIYLLVKMGWVRRPY